MKIFYLIKIIIILNYHFLIYIKNFIIEYFTIQCYSYFLLFHQILVFLPFKNLKHIECKNLKFKLISFVLNNSFFYYFHIHYLLLI